MQWINNTNGINTYYTTWEAPFTFTMEPPKKEKLMNTRVYRLAAGFIGVVTMTIDNDDVPVADTAPYKTYAKAEKAVKKLAIDVVKNGVSGV